MKRDLTITDCYDNNQRCFLIEGLYKFNGTNTNQLRRDLNLIPNSIYFIKKISKDIKSLSNYKDISNLYSIDAGLQSFPGLYKINYFTSFLLRSIIDDVYIRIYMNAEPIGLDNRYNFHRNECNNEDNMLLELHYLSELKLYKTFNSRSELNINNVINFLITYIKLIDTRDFIK